MQIFKQQIVISIGCNCFLHTYAKVIINFSIYLVVYNSKCNHGAVSQCQGNSELNTHHNEHHANAIRNNKDILFILKSYHLFSKIQ